MADERDFNDVLENIFVNEEIGHRNSFEEGFKAGKEAGNPEGYHLGYHRGAELGRELGYYLGAVTYYIQTNENADTKYSEKILNQLTKVKELIDAFPHTNSEDHDILNMAEKIRAQYKKACALLKISSNNPYGVMDPNMLKLHGHIDSILTYLTPLLPLANCHMVEFLTQNHWDNLLPKMLRESLDEVAIDKAVEKFWTSCENTVCDKSALSQWVHSTRSHCLTVNNEYCLSVAQLEDRIKSWGGAMVPEIRVKEFMNSKKSYEVRTMSRLLASLHNATRASLALEAGGGRGPLLASASRAHGIRCLTVDCDAAVLASAEARGRAIQKQWHAIAKELRDGVERSLPRPPGDRHRFARLFITQDSDLATLARDSFPELTGDVRVLLTGLHTCGDLGPNSLRIFARQPAMCAALTAPCCYHLLSEELDAAPLDSQPCQGILASDSGFPMSEHLRGFNLGRNARMLAAQSIDRVVSQRQWPARSLLYRALLQDIIKRHKPEFVLAEGKLKRLAAKTQDFVQYFKMADSILNLELFDSVRDSYVSHVDCQWKKMVLFYLIRLCLAQVIESLILLDRLLFLRENGFENSFLVKLFDPVLSPRCHSIVVVR